MAKVDIAGLKIDAISKKEFLDAALERIKAGQKTFVTTPYSEFLYGAFQKPDLLEIFNKADFALADGIGIFWARRYLSIPLTAKSYWGKILQSLWQLKYSLAAIIFNRQWIQSALPEKIVGADLIWDLAKLASENHLSMFLLGGFGDTTELTRQKLISNYPNLQISVSNQDPEDSSAINEIKNTSPDILLVAYGPIKQEAWIARHLFELPVKLAIGVGGTFDYVAGKRPSPPQFLRSIGLEWLWRLFTQPHRAKRIWQATFGLSYETFLYKAFLNLPYRKNVVAVIIKNKTQIFIGQRNPHNPKNYTRKNEIHKYLDYWQLPQGGTGGEDLITAAKREVEEETGINNLQVIKISDSVRAYDFRPSLKRLFDKEYHFKGQIQNIVYFEFLGTDNDISIDKKELINWRWVNLKELDKAIHPERRPLAEIVLKDLA